MDVAVLQSSAGSKVQWFYNKLLGVFSDRVRGVVEGELQLQLESKAQELKLQLRTLVAGVSACSFASLSGGNLSHCTHYSSGRHTLTRVCLSGLGKEIGESMDSAGIDRASWDSAEMEDASERTAALAASGLLRESARSVDLKPAG